MKEVIIIIDDKLVYPEPDEDSLLTIYSEISKLIGFENTMILYDHFAGKQLFFPQKIFRPSYVAKLVEKNYTGNNMTKLAYRLGYSPRRLWQIMKIEKEKNGSRELTCDNK